VLLLGVFGAVEDIAQANREVPVGLMVVWFPLVFIQHVHPRYRAVAVPVKIIESASRNPSSTNSMGNTKRELTVGFIRPSPFQICVFGTSVRLRIGIVLLLVNHCTECQAQGVSYVAQREESNALPAPLPLDQPTDSGLPTYCPPKQTQTSLC
jgi:hypothetical protein